MKRLHILLLLLGLTILAVPFRDHIRHAIRSTGVAQAATVAKRQAQYGPRARERWKPYFHRASVAYPPRKVMLIGLKDEDILQVYAMGKSGKWRFVRAYPILAASGQMGPKLREGDNQVPEGIYRVESLNPNSQYHLSLRVNYPNAFDRKMAKRDGRKNLGGDIMIHGNACSIGCLAMGDEAAEDLFILAADTGIQHVGILLCPCDLRTAKAPIPGDLPWVKGLYQQIGAELAKLPPGGSPH